MAIKKIKFYYYQPKKIIKNEKEKITEYPFLDFKNILEELMSMDLSDRIKTISEQDIIQLKHIERPCTENKNKWQLCFLRNTTETSFKNKISESVEKAETLDEDEFLGQETCCLYDEKTNILAIQNNIRSIGFTYIGQFFTKFIDNNHLLKLEVLINSFDRDLNEEDDECRSLIIGIADINEFKKSLKSINEEQSDDLTMIKKMCNIAEDMGTTNFKYEFTIGRVSKSTKNKTLGIKNVNKLISILRGKDEVKTLQMKINNSNDIISTIDLIQNKVYGTFSIVVEKSNPKTFEKILNPMNDIFQQEIKKNTFKNFMNN